MWKTIWTNFYKKPLRQNLGLYIQIDPSKFQLDSSNRFCAILHTTLKNSVSSKTRLKFEDVMNNHFSWWWFQRDVRYTTEIQKTSKTSRPQSHSSHKNWTRNCLFITVITSFQWNRSRPPTSSTAVGGQTGR